MEDFKLEKAFMAVKAQRFDEAQNAYEESLEKNYSVEAWTGLGVCKLFQLASNQTMEEVIYCFKKAKEVQDADLRDIDLQLISYSHLVVEQLSNYCLLLIDEIKKANTAKNIAIVASAVAASISSSSEKIKTSITAGVVAGASAGVAIGKMSEIIEAEKAGNFTLKIISEIHSKVNHFLLDNKMLDEAKAFDNRVIELSEIISKASIKYKEEKNDLLLKLIRNWYPDISKKEANWMFWKWWLIIVGICIGWGLIIEATK